MKNQINEIEKELEREIEKISFSFLTTEELINKLKIIRKEDLVKNFKIIELEAKLSGYKLAKEEFNKKIDELKRRSTGLTHCNDFQKLINKIFTEEDLKEKVEDDNI